MSLNVMSVTGAPGEDDMGRSVRAIAAAAALGVAATGCGGGGGGGGGSGGCTFTGDGPALSPATDPRNTGAIGTLGGGGFTVSSPSLSFTSAGGSVPATQTLTLAWTSPAIAGFIGGYVAPVRDPCWLHVAPTPVPCPSPCPVHLSVDPAALPAMDGTYATTLTFIGGTADYAPIGYRDVRITVVRHP
jgi:hypothetical protein